MYNSLLDDYQPLRNRGIFHATLEARGLYNTFQFVLRLSPLVHRKLSSIPGGMHSSNTTDFEGIEALSTYLHETIHWWQHVGSTYGLIMSLVYPAQAHANHSHLKDILSKMEFKKSILDLAKVLPNTGVDSVGGLAAIVVNNHFDMASYRALTVSPLTVEEIVQSPLFENQGHSFHIALSNIVTLLASVSDPEFKKIPHPKDWGRHFQVLRDSKEQGFYYGSPISLYPLGAYEIFEGQARLAQLQFLYFSTEGRFDMEAAEQRGMFDGVYGKAFSAFLTLTELERPSSINHPTIALFLLICDISINPGTGFPFPLINFPTIIHDADPGSRFVSLSKMARSKCPHILGQIREYTREEYRYVSQTLCDAIIEHSPLQIAEEFSIWLETPDFKQLLAQHHAYKYTKDNLVVRVLFSHFLSFMQDKLITPEVFCWPGAWLAGERASWKTGELFTRHSALFVDKEEDDGIFPRIGPGQTEEDVQEVFQGFYANNVIFDLTQQWIAEPGPFKFDYRWLTQNGSNEELKEYAERHFEAIYGVRPSAVKFVQG